MRAAVDVPPPPYMDEDLVIFRDSTARFLETELKPRVGGWVESGIVDRQSWKDAADQGLACLSMPEGYGGGGGDFRHETVLMEEISYRGIEGFGLPLHNAIVAPYVLHYGSEDQKQSWLPRLASGDLIGAIAMTEPGAGSDLQGVRTSAKRDGDDYVINGQKTFITNGQNANFIIVVTKTDPGKGAKGVSLLAVETDEVEGFRRGRNLSKMGQKAQDTSELFFDDVRVPAGNLIGSEEGQGFFQLMEQLPQERLMIGLISVANIETALHHTIEYVKERKAFGKRILDFQNTQFKLAECKTEATVARVFIDHCIGVHLDGKLDATTASMAKYWVSDLQSKITDECLQLFGGYGYMNEYPISHLYTDARVQRIYGGTNEIMKVLIARSLDR